MLTLHRSERTSELADALGEVLRRPLADVLATEVVAVPAKGVERWLTQRLATVLGRGDGVAAGIAFPSPARLVDDAVAAASGTTAEEDAWAPGRVLWALLALVDDCLDEPWCAVLAAHLGRGEEGHRTGRRYATAEHLRDLFRAYEAARPQMLLDWAAGDDTDGAGAALDDDLRWQAELWRRLRARQGVPSGAERLGPTCARLRDEPECSGLPERLSVFGATRLTTAQRRVLEALGVARDVHLWVPHASPAMWEALRGRPAPQRRSDDDSALAVRHPLLASLARDTRELQLLSPDVPDVHLPGPEPAGSLLGRLQAAVRDDVPPAAGGAADRSVQVHACHGAPRQVEVLREALLHLFAADPTLEPRDVLVMCPDVETYAPLVRAAFGQPGAGHPGHRLRVRLADRSLRSTNPLLDTVRGLLALADGRVTASQVLDLAATPPVRRQFAFRDDDLDRLADWAARTGVRWGLGPLQRRAYALGKLPHGTWRTGLDRLLVGVAADSSDLAFLSTALPLEEVDSTDVEVAGRLAELVHRLDAVLGRLQGAQPVRDWVDALLTGLDQLTDVADEDAWQAVQARRELAEAAEHGGDAVLRLADVRAMLETRLAGRPTRANFRTGELTVATLVPMRSVPHRVVALLGIDDGVFPRAGTVDGDDVLQRDPCVGERDVRTEDRQLLLDAVMSASDALVLLYTGADPVTGLPRPPAVPLGELLDVLRVTLDDPGLAGVLRHHPLQPFDPRGFCAPEPFSHDRGALAGARATLAPRRPPGGLLEAALPPRSSGRAGTGDVALSDLVALLVHPARAFLAQRLGVRLPDADDQVRDALPADLEPLQKWDVGDRMLAARLAGVEGPAFEAAEWRRGTLPPGVLGRDLLADLRSEVEPIVQASLPVHAGPPGTYDVDVVLDAAGRRLTGTVGGVHGAVLAGTSWSRLAAKHRVTAWVRLLALAASGGPVSTAVTTGRGERRRPVQRSTLVVPPDPLGVLRDLVALYDEGVREPLPLVTGASAVYADRRHGGDTPADALVAAEKAWSDRFGDATDETLALVQGGPPQLSVLTGCADPGPEGTRFGALARRLWEPLLQAETLGAP